MVEKVTPVFEMLGFFDQTESMILLSFDIKGRKAGYVLTGPRFDHSVLENPDKIRENLQTSLEEIFPAEGFTLDKSHIS